MYRTLNRDDIELILDSLDYKKLNMTPDPERLAELEALIAKLRFLRDGRKAEAEGRERKR
jgi:hypothetical protein